MLWSIEIQLMGKGQGNAGGLTVMSSPKGCQVNKLARQTRNKLLLKPVKICHLRDDYLDLPDLGYICGLGPPQSRRLRQHTLWPRIVHR